MEIVFFDFDGTITKKDTFPEFIKFAVGKKKYAIGLIRNSSMLIKYLLGLMSNHSAKERVFGHFFKNWGIALFDEYAKYFSLELGKIIRPGALEQIRLHKEKGHKVVIVSASIRNYLQQWCADNKCELIATEVEIEDDKLTGKFATKNCYGEEKIKRIKENYDLNIFSHIYAYGNSRGDKEMLEIADKASFRPFR